MRVKLEINNSIKSSQSDDQKSILDMIVKKNMTIGSLKKKLDISSEAIDRVMVNGVRRSEYYSLNPGDRITFERERSNENDNKNEEKNEKLKSEVD